MRSKTVEKNEKRQKRRSIDQSAESVSKKKDKSEKAKVELRHTLSHFAGYSLAIPVLPEFESNVRTDCVYERLGRETKGRKDAGESEVFGRKCLYWSSQVAINVD